jgi:Aspartate-semialdehyde dehydrogenase
MNIAIVGATGLVGRKIIKLCEEFFDTSVEFHYLLQKRLKEKYFQ